MLLRVESSSLTLTTSRFVYHVRLYRGQLFVFLTVEFFDRHVCRLEDSHMNAAAAVLAPVAPPPMLADADAAALLAVAALPPMLAEAAAAALLAGAAPPPVLADAAAAALLAPGGPPPVRTGHAAVVTTRRGQNTFINPGLTQFTLIYKCADNV